MDNWQRICIAPDAVIKTAIAAIDVGGIGLALVVDADGRLLGTITDGDIRRALLKDISLQEPIASVMQVAPTVARCGESSATILCMMQQKKLQQIPVVDNDNHIVDVETLANIIQTAHQENPVVIMAGGFGTRLAPLTKETPKPMLKVANKPMLEILLEQLITAGFKQFYFAVHYQSQVIKNYFQNGDRWQVNIQYLEESQPLGTAGALSLLPSDISKPTLVMNGDIMTQINFNHLMQFHAVQHAAATLCVREYRQSIPFGVVESSQHQLTALKEKPSQQYYVNAGIYLLEPSVIQQVPANQATNMTDLLTQVTEQGKSVAVFPIREYWLDIGQMETFQQAQVDYEEFFNVDTA